LVAADTFLARHARALLVAAGVLALGVLACWLVAKTTGLISPADARFRIHQFVEYRGPARDVAMTIATLGDSGVALVTVAALAAVSYTRGGMRAALLPFAAAGVVVFTTIAKDLPGGRETTLPSGHTAYAVAVGGFAAWMLAVAGRPLRAAVLLALCLLMAPARVIEGAHRPIDVVTGAALGLAWLLVVLVLGRRQAARQEVRGAAR
jgi:membrane-associated phospholipid phosphatase